MGIYSLSLLATSLLLSCFLLVFGWYVDREIKGQMLASTRTTLMARKNLAEEGSTEQKIDRWIAAIETNNKEYPYILQAPKVAEVLAWLSSHPLLEELKREGDPIELGEMRYQLVKFPKIGALKEPYLAKVDLTFSCKSSINARRFHEELYKGDHLVDSRLEVTWEALNEGYRTSFFLKNRSPHVF